MSRPVMVEKVKISAKRHISVKLWPPTPHPQWGMSRATIADTVKKSLT